MQSEKTSKTSQKVASKKVLGAVEAVKAETAKPARVKKTSVASSSATKKAGASPKHHHSNNGDKSNVTPVAVIPTVPDRREISQEAIAVLAYSLWAERGHAHGHAEEDWFRAEQELMLAR